jgi:hypothetical protein
MLDLCRHRGHGALVQRVRADRAGVPEGGVPACAGAQWERTGLPDRARRGAGFAGRARPQRGLQIPPRPALVRLARNQ